MNQRTLAAPSFLSLFLLLISVPDGVAVAGAKYTWNQRGGEGFVLYQGHEYKLYVPRPGLPLDWKTVTELGSGIGETFSSMACMSTFGWARSRKPEYFAMEGVLSNGITALDIVSFVPNGYSVRAFTPTTVASPVQVIVPKAIVSQIEQLAANRRYALYNDYSIVFLFERRFGSGLMNGCQIQDFVNEYIPVGRHLDTNALAGDAWEKGVVAYQIIQFVAAHAPPQ